MDITNRNVPLVNDPLYARALVIKSENTTIAIVAVDAVAIEEIGSQVRCRILCASDPYAVVGVRTAFGFQPDLVTGPAANTEAGIDLVVKLTGVRALNMMDRSSHDELASILRKKLEPAW